MSHHLRYFLVSFLLLNFISSSFLQENSMNFYQPPKYNVGQGNDYMNLKLRNAEYPGKSCTNVALPMKNSSLGPINEKSTQQQIPPPSQPVPSFPKNDISDSKPSNQKNSELQRMVQQLYMAQAQVQLEATEIHKAQTIATAAQKRLEEASNNVRVITSALRQAQEAVANSAQHAQTAQLQLAAHDQLLFTARQKVDALSAQLVGLQAEVGIAGDPMSVNVQALLEKLKEPLHPNDQPKPPVSIINTGSESSAFGGNEYQSHKLKTTEANWNDYKQYVLEQQRNHDVNNMPHKLKRSFHNQSDDNQSSDNQSNDSQYNDNQSNENQSDVNVNMISSADVKALLDWIHEENRKDIFHG